MSENNFESKYYLEIIDFISEKDKNIVSDKISLREIKDELEKKLKEAMHDLTVRFVHKDYWPDDDNYQEIQEYIYFIEEKIKNDK